MEEARSANNVKVMAVLKRYLLKAGPSTSLEVQPISEESETSVNVEIQK